jgi:hypothetical protein
MRFARPAATPRSLSGHRLSEHVCDPSRKLKVLGCGTPVYELLTFVNLRRDGLCPNRPQHDAGIRIDPPPSPPDAIGTNPVATLAPEPPLDPPAVRSSIQGLRVAPCRSVSTTGRRPSSDVAVLATGTTPASSQRRYRLVSSVGGFKELEDHGVDLGVQPLDPRNACLHELGATDLAGSNQLGEAQGVIRVVFGKAQHRPALPQSKPPKQ